MEVEKCSTSVNSEDKPTETVKKANVSDDVTVTPINVEKISVSEPLSISDDSVTPESDNSKSESPKTPVEEDKNKIETEKNLNEEKQKETAKKEKLEATKVEQGAKKPDATKVEQQGTKKPDATKVDPQGTKKPDATKVEPQGAKKADKPEEIKVDGKKKEEQSKSAKENSPSPLASFFKDWDKFTSGQKKDIENRIKNMAARLTSSGSRSESWRRSDRRYMNRERRRRISRRYPLGRRPSRTPIDSARDRRWRSPWETTIHPPSQNFDHLIRQMDSFINMMSNISMPYQAHKELGERAPLLPSPPPTYQVSNRYASLQYKQPIHEDNTARKYGGDTYSSPPKKSSPETSRLSGHRASPYPNNAAYYRYSDRQKEVTERSTGRQDTSRFITEKRRGYFSETTYDINVSVNIATSLETNTNSQPVRVIRLIKDKYR